MNKTTITALHVWRGEVALRMNFRHHLASRDQVETLIVSATTSAGTVGYGQALPREYLTGETIDSCLDDIRRRWRPMLADLVFDPEEGGRAFLEVLRGVYAAADERRLLASYAPVDLAVVDAVARAGKIEGRLLWGAAPREAPLVGVISATSPGKAAMMARGLRIMGYRHFKVKVGENESADTRRLQAVRSSIGPTAWLSVDANGAWEAAEARERIDGMRRFGVAVVEEPLRPDSGTTLGRLEKDVGVPVMADESLCGRADAEKLLAEGSPSWWNLRLAKVGGFSGLAELGRLAAAHNIKAYGGILVGETSCLAAAGMAATGLADFHCLEYGFPRFLLRGDPFRGGPGGFTGKSQVSHRYGLGVTLNDKKLASFIPYE